MVELTSANYLNPQGGLQNVQQDEIQNAGQAQNLEHEQLGNDSAGSLYATQVLSGATATGRQDLYNQALQHLNGMGVDTSSFAPDIATGSQQVNALRQAYYNANPLNAMLGLGLHAEGNLNSAAGVTGNTQTAGSINPLSAMIAGGMAARMNPAGSTPSQPVPSNINQMPPQAAQTYPITPVLASALQPIQGQPTPQSNSALPMPPSPSQIASQPVSGNPIDAYGSTATQFMPPQRDNGETQAAYNQRVQQAMEQWKANPAVVQQTSMASNLGTETGKQTGAAAESAAMYQKLAANLAAMKAINSSVPDGTFLNPQTKEDIDNRLGDGALASLLGVKGDAGNLASWDQINHAMALNGLAQLINQSAVGSSIRSNKSIFDALKTGSGVPSNLPAADRLNIINNLQAELENTTAASQNVKNALTGQPYVPYSVIPAAASAGSTPQTGALQKGTDGTYVFTGGDPSQQSNWQKVQ